MVQKSCVHQLRLVVEISLFRGFHASKRWLALGFLNHQQYVLNEGDFPDPVLTWMGCFDEKSGWGLDFEGILAVTWGANHQLVYI